MTAYTGFVYPVPELAPQALSSSLTAGLDRPHDYAIADPYAGVLSNTATVTPIGATPIVSRTGLAAFTVPTWADYLFGNILVIPSRLDLGNLLSNQQRSVEIANLYLTARSWTAASSAIVGLTLPNAPTFPYAIPSFGSFVMQVGISATGPASISGNVELDFDVVTVFLPVTGRRIIVWQFSPQVPVSEILEWKTDVLEAWDGTEQRASMRAVPRQRIGMSFTLFDAIDTRVRALEFDWLARPFAVPIWWEARATTIDAVPGDTTINVPTDSADFVVGNLAMIYADDLTYDACEISAVNTNTLVLASQIANGYPAGSLVMPMRTCYAKTVPTHQRITKAGATVAMEFTTTTGTNHADTTGSTLYQSKVLLDDPNLLASGASDSWDRTVIVNDSGSGRVFQTSSKDRSRFRTAKVWDAPTRAEVWRVRKLLHALAGSRVSCFLPSFRCDLTLSQAIGASSTTLRVLDVGYSTFFKARRPFADIRLVRRNGTNVVRNVTSATLDPATDEEVLTIDSAFDSIVINPTDVVRIEIVNMVRIADDQASFTHRKLGDATISVNLVSVKE